MEGGGSQHRHGARALISPGPAHAGISICLRLRKVGKEWSFFHRYFGLILLYSVSHGRLGVDQVD